MSLDGMRGAVNAGITFAYNVLRFFGNRTRKLSEEGP
jgi:hypothetical protein